jgi:hypothetical protein
MEDVTALSLWITRTYNEGVADFMNGATIPRNLSPAQMRWLSAWEKLHTNDQIRLLGMYLLGARMPYGDFDDLKQQFGEPT